MLEGSRLQPRDMLDASQPTHIGHKLYVGAKGEPDGLTENQMNSKSYQSKSLKQGSAQAFIPKNHVTCAHTVL